MQQPDDDDLILEPGGVGPGRPFIGPKIAVRLSPECVAQLDRFAAESGITRSELIRSAVGWYLAATLRPPQDREWMHVRDSGGNAVAIIDDLFRGTTRPPSSRQADDEFDLRSEIEASAEAQGLSPAALLGVGYGAVLARRGGK